MTRAAHLIRFIDFFRDMGAPVDRELARARLPILIEDMPHALVSNRFAHEFVSNSSHRSGAADLGWRAARDFGTTQFATELQNALSAFPAVKQRLEAFCALARIEDRAFRGSVALERDGLRVVSEIEDWRSLRNYQYSEWLLVGAVINVVCSVAGPRWRPAEITFRSGFALSDEAQAAYPNTRIRVRADSTSVLISSQYLATVSPSMSPYAHYPGEVNVTAFSVNWLRDAISPYVYGGAPTLELAAELAGISPRSLQRRLREAGHSFRAVLDTARFDAAKRLLDDPDNKVIDVGLALGYDSPQHFARSFRRICGLSPREFRYQRLSSSGEASVL